MKVCPRLNDAASSEEKDEYYQFQRELARTKNLVDRAPKSDPNRRLDRAARNMPEGRRIQFIEISNKFLVSLLKTLYHINLSIRTTLPISTG